MAVLEYPVLPHFTPPKPLLCCKCDGDELVETRGEPGDLLVGLLENKKARSPAMPEPPTGTPAAEVADVAVPPAAASFVCHRESTKELLLL